MPDGLTHLLTGYIFLQKWLKPGPLFLFLTGGLMPDILLRGGRVLFLGHPQEDFFEMYLAPLHTPMGSLFVCIAIAQFFQSKIRRKVFSLLYLGCFAHFILDFFQRTIAGIGYRTEVMDNYHWLYPISWYDFQFGLFWPENAPYALIALVPIAGWIFMKKLKSRERRG
ncbi:hypothetical protein ACFL9T_06210 [Thermodesulfobacteriota bacterium]